MNRNPDFPRMIYQVGDQEAMHGSHFNYMTVEDQDTLDALLSMGWHMTTEEAKNAAIVLPEPVTGAIDTVDEDSEPTRAELEMKANELGIKFDGRTTDRKLNTLIIDKLAE
jgi:hypothetical protein